MDHIKKLLLAVFAVNILVMPVFAGLLEDVDKLTPEQAELFQKKLDQKKFEGLPKNSRIAGFVQTVDPAQFNNSFPGLPPIRNIYGGTFDLRHPLSDNLLIGGSFGGAGNYVFKESSSKVYEDLFLVSGSAQLVLECRIFHNNNFILSVTPGAGVMLGFYNYSKTDDNARTHYNTNRWGSGFCTSLALDATWKINNDWGLGIGASTFSGKLGNMRKIISNVDSSAPEIDLTGTTFRIAGSKIF